MSGFTDAFYKALFEKYSPEGDLTSYSKYPGVDAGDLSPTIWFQPTEVIALLPDDSRRET